MNGIGIGIGTADGDGDENGCDADAEMGRRRGRVRALGDYIMVRRWMSCVPLYLTPCPAFCEPI